MERYGEAAENFRLNGLPDRNLYDGYMQKFRYRYVTELDERFTFDYIEEALFDGSHDKLHDGGLMKYHDAAKPRKLALSWHIEKSVYCAYFWFDEVQMRRAFEACFNEKTDADAERLLWPLLFSEATVEVRGLKIKSLMQIAKETNDKGLSEELNKNRRDLEEYQKNCSIEYAQGIETYHYVALFRRYGKEPVINSKAETKELRKKGLYYHMSVIRQDAA